MSSNRTLITRFLLPSLSGAAVGAIIGLLVAYQHGTKAAVAGAAIGATLNIIIAEILSFEVFGPVIGLLFAW